MTLRIGTRRSRLALAQAEEVRALLAGIGVESELVPMSTAGDRGESPTDSIAGLKGLWVNDIVRALRESDIDLAVHSAKDLPAEDEDGVVIAAVPERASPLDVLVTRDGELPEGGRIGTSSLRRQAQVWRWRPDVLLTDIRGNVDTRLRKLEEGEVEGLILAAAGLLRLGIVPEHAAPMSLAEMVPAPGQGALALQTRDDDSREAVARLDHRDSRIALEAERRLTAMLGGGCALPLGAHASIDAGRVRLIGLVASPDGGQMIRTTAEASSALEAAERAAEDLRSQGAEEILAKARP
ncbi:MAG: hydroxymethylbilane synthase [Actinomycetota bacterium]